MHIEMASLLPPTKERAHCPPGTASWTFTAVSRHFPEASSLRPPAGYSDK